MTTLSVQGPMDDGLYYLGYKDSAGTFFLIEKFVSFQLACAMVGKMLSDRAREARAKDEK